MPEDTPTIPVGKVGIVGAGTMGGGIAMNFANAGIPVTIVETKAEALDRGLGVIRRNYENTARKGRMTAEDVERRMGLLAGSLDLEQLADCDLVIEAVFENMAIKKEVFAKLDGIVKQGAILASNTSYLDIDEIASVTKRPEFVIGMHFFSPANVMRLLEVVRGDRTAKPVVATAMQLARRIGKIGVLVGVCHGFVGNRMLAPRQREANKLILEGAMPWDVDRVLYRFRISDGALRHGRPCRARYRLVAGNIQGRDGPRDPLRARPARPEDGGGLLRLRREPQREALEGRRAGHPRPVVPARDRAAGHPGRGDPRALHLSR